MTKLLEAMADPAKKGVKKYWDYGSKFYDETPGLCREEENNLWKEMLGEAIGPAPKKVLDVGTGTGYIALLLAELGYQVTGVDFSPMMLETARRKTSAYQSSVTLMEGDAENPPFESESFDAVTARYVLWTLAHPEAAMAQWIRVLKPGGRLVVIDGYWVTKGLLRNICRINFQWYRRLKFGKRMSTDEYDDELSQLLPHPRGVHKEDIEGYLAGAGLADVAGVDLKRIRAAQIRQTPWYLKYAFDFPIYLFSGTRPPRH